MYVRMHAMYMYAYRGLEKDIGIHIIIQERLVVGRTRNSQHTQPLLPTCISNIILTHHIDTSKNTCICESARTHTNIL
jgi:hypothetical protein